MRRYVPALLLALVALTPLLGCDLLKPKDADAGAEAGVVTTPAVTTAAATDTAAVPGATPAAPLTPGAPAVSPNGQPVKRADGGVAVADAGPAAKSDAAAPVTPTMPQFPGFDAGAFKGFDAGGLFRIPDGGFKPPF